jgi:hypothetical protein
MKERSKEREEKEFELLRIAYKIVLAAAVTVTNPEEWCIMARRRAEMLN